MKLENIPFRFESELVKRWHRLTGRRPSSAPFLSGDGFRALTPWRWESRAGEGFSADAVPEGGLVFVEAWHLKAALEALGRAAPRRFRVMTGNGDPNFGDQQTAWIPDNVTELWVQNLSTRHPKVRALPIGLENARYHANGIARDFRSLRRRAAPAKNRILWGFAEVTNPTVRGAARAALEVCPTADRQPPVNSRLYRRAAGEYRFIASPPGNGDDCHRTWEALYLRSVPIVLRSPMTEAFADRGLPLWLVDTYDELRSATEADLDARYRALAPGFDHPALWMDYWKKELHP